MESAPDVLTVSGDFTRIVVVRILRRYASGRQKGEALLGWLEGLASALEKGKIPSQYREWESLEDENIDYKPRWRVLGKLCKSLEQIAGKHLAGSPLDPEDDKTIFDQIHFTAYILQFTLFRINSEQMNHHFSSFKQHIRKD